MKLAVKVTGFMAYQTHRWLGGRLLSAQMPYRIVYYHLVAPKNPLHYFSDKGIGVDDFKKQVAFYKRRYKIITLHEAYEMVQHGESLNGCLSITTDDGFTENYSQIAPVLIDAGLKATLFLTYNLLDNNELMWRNKLAYINNTQDSSRIFQSMNDLASEHQLPMPQSPAELMVWSKNHFPMSAKDELASKLWSRLVDVSLNEYLATKRPYLMTGQIKELIYQGFEIGAHSLSHPYFDALTYPEVVSEALGSVQSLERQFDVPVHFFSYPFGVRCKPDFEKALLHENGAHIKSCVGIKNKMANNSSLNWERDNQETDFYSAMFRFLVLPYIRRAKSL